MSITPSDTQIQAVLLVEKSRRLVDGDFKQGTDSQEVSRLGEVLILNEAAVLLSNEVIQNDAESVIYR